MADDGKCDKGVRFLRLVGRAVVGTVLVVTAACSSAGTNSQPNDRAMIVTGSGCGLAPNATGSGVAIGDDLALTVAHVVARVEELSVTDSGGVDLAASVIHLDLRRDLAVLRVPGLGLEPLELVDAGREAEGWMVGGLRSGTVAFTVEDVNDIRIEEVLGTERHLRRGYRLAMDAADGDSGAGLYDSDNRLVGVLFAVEPGDNTAWATAATEIMAVLGDLDRDGDPLACDTELSRLVP